MSGCQDGCYLSELFSVVVSPRDDLLASWPQENSMLKLGGVAPFNVAERRIGIHDTLVAEVF